MDFSYILCVIHIFLNSGHLSPLSPNVPCMCAEPSLSFGNRGSRIAQGVLGPGGVATTFRLGGGEGRMQVSQNHLPQILISHLISPHYFENVGKSKMVVNIQKMFSQSRDFWGDVPLEF